MGFIKEVEDNFDDDDPSGDNCSISDTEDEQQETPLGIMNWRAMRWVKIVSIIVIGTFLFQQVVWAADNDISAIIMTLKGQVTNDILPPDVLEKLEIENYALMDDAMGAKESSKPSYLSPSVLESAQTSREQEIDRRNELEDSLLEKRLSDMESEFDKALQSLKAEKTSPFDEEEEESARALGGARGGGRAAGAPFDYTLSDWNEDGEPERLDIYNYDDNGNLINITSYDISDIDKSKWLEAGREVEDEDGSFYGGYIEDIEDLEKELSELEEYIISKIVYKTDKEGRRVVDYVLGGYKDGTPTTISYYDYDKDGLEKWPFSADYADAALDEIRTYSLEGLEEEIEGNSKDSDWFAQLTDDKLIKTSVFEGKKNYEKVVYTLEDYEKNEDGEYVPTTMSVFDYTKDSDGEDQLTQTRTYDISDYIDSADWESYLADLRFGDEETLAEYENDLSMVALYSGAAGEENVDRVLYYADGQIVERVDYEYEEYEVKYSKHKKKALRKTMRYDTLGLSEEDAKQRGAGVLLEESTFIGPAGGERIDQTFYYDEEGNIIERKDYIYDGEGRLVSTFTFDTEGVEEGVDRREKLGDEDGDGDIDYEDALLAENGTLIEESTFKGLKGREKIDQTFYYDEEGNIIVRNDYIYDEEGRLTGAFTFDTEDVEEDRRGRRPHYREWHAR
jgi:hypothetical protein